jgi:3'-phosphoadenosine 5'-phosphosulfate sulfotransferase (PAPS reductase)/FAD synthetase
LCVSPIFYWSDAEVQRYITGESNFPVEILNDLRTSPECWCGAYKSKSDFEKLYKSCPELYNKLAKLEMDSRTNFTFIYENGKKLSLIELKHEIVNARV